MSPLTPLTPHRSAPVSGHTHRGRHREERGRWKNLSAVALDALECSATCAVIAVRVIEKAFRAHSAEAYENGLREIGRMASARACARPRCPGIYVTAGYKLYSDVAEVLMTVVEDTVGHHDRIGGA